MIVNTLRKYGIDPITGTENIVWAPMGVPGQHDFEALEKVYHGLINLEANGAEFDDIVEFLEQMGRIASTR